MILVLHLGALTLGLDVVGLGGRLLRYTSNERPDAAMVQRCRVSCRYLILSVPREPLWKILNLIRGAHLPRLGDTLGHLQHWSRTEFLS